MDVGTGKSLSFTPSLFSSSRSTAELISVALTKAALASWVRLLIVVAHDRGPSGHQRVRHRGAAHVLVGVARGMPQPSYWYSPFCGVPGSP